MRAISLFSGAGGMDVGFENAGVKIELANELDKYACETYFDNHKNTELLQGDIREYRDEFIKNVGIDIIFGGPPCQGFSVAGKMDPNDERSKLIWDFLDVVRIVKPKTFVMENVKALGKLDKWKSIRSEFVSRSNELGYFCDFFVLNASDYGVSQNRERVFFIGSLEKYDSENMLASLYAKKQIPLPLRELLKKLPKAGTDEHPITCTANVTLAKNPIMRRSPYAGMMFNGLGRPLNLDSVSATLPASMGGNKTPIIDEKLLSDPQENDWVQKYHDGLLNKETHPSSNHVPKHLRRLTIMEAALIQSFPLDYSFKGTKSAIYAQIGNAVPCKLAESVAKSVIEVCFEGVQWEFKESNTQMKLF
jgi:DNA (cytosine-5)-methyltransferase 1